MIGIVHVDVSYILRHYMCVYVCDCYRLVSTCWVLSSFHWIDLWPSSTLLLAFKLSRQWIFSHRFDHCVMDVLKHSIGASEGDSFCSQTVNALQVINIHFNLHCPSFTLQLFYPELLLPPKKTQIQLCDDCSDHTVYWYSLFWCRSFSVTVHSSPELPNCLDCVSLKLSVKLQEVNVTEGH